MILSADCQQTGTDLVQLPISHHAQIMFIIGSTDLSLNWAESGCKGNIFSDIHVINEHCFEGISMTAFQHVVITQSFKCFRNIGYM